MRPTDDWIEREVRGQGNYIWRCLRRGQLSHIHTNEQEFDAR